MKTLVIHPRDGTTTFLNRVYEDLNEVTLVRGGADQAQIRDMIDSHDQVMLMGHGTANGLLSVGQFPDVTGYVVDAHLAPALAEKKNAVFIWCNADQYVIANELWGFYTGMFISEVCEAYLMGLTCASERQVKESNVWFGRTVGNAAKRGVEQMYAAATDRYGRLAKCNPVVQYNHARMYIS